MCGAWSSVILERKKLIYELLDSRLRLMGPGNQAVRSGGSGEGFLRCGWG